MVELPNKRHEIERPSREGSGYTLPNLLNPALNQLPAPVKNHNNGGDTKSRGLVGECHVKLLLSYH